MLKSAGDGMTMFKDAKILKDEVMTDVDVLSDSVSYTHLDVYKRQPVRPGLSPLWSVRQRLMMRRR